MEVPYLDLSFANLNHKLALLAAVERVIDSGWTILGKEVEQFEMLWASYVGTRYAIGVANGLDAMIIALEVLGVGPADEVIVPSNTYIATWLAVSRVGAKIIPVEPDITTFNIDAAAIQKAISPRTKAAIVVHLYGRPCPMKEIMEMAGASGIFIIEDNAQAQGASTDGQMTGSFGHINATSLYPGKNFGALGDAGVITTNQKEWSEKCRVYRNYGSQNKYENELLGYNSRLDEVQAAMLSVKLEFLKENNVFRAHIANTYNEQLSGIDKVFLPTLSPGNVWHIYPILVERRDALMSYLKENGIGTLIHYPIPAHLQKAYAHLGYQLGDFPIAEKIAAEILSLPIYPGMRPEQVEYVCEKIKAFFKK
ncbi:MAG TPA: DegT/DnrJ/EryC1/StrS family aminotransferase [Saprospiraceae bacterium]|nr:DegT/DnrJ/EryC1/StrS family aminotransferase [Saprospiraceae bacterium]